MNLSFLDAVPARAQRLDYRALQAMLHAGQSTTPAKAPCALQIQLRTAPANVCLAVVILGLKGWRQASLALGGCFNPSAKA